jgi:hypothetical protein
MYPFWSSIVEPLLKVHRPKVIVEVGSEAGLNLARLVNFAIQHDAAVHAVDPKPLFDVEEWTRRSGGRLTVHRDVSLKVIPRLPPFDTLFIDGDHNWYTVFHELKAIESRSTELAQPFPLVLLHDIGWPWGRRDLYYAPDTIPPQFRQPYTQPDKRAASQAGFHADFCRAVQEGGPRNGVLTAVEDFLKESPESQELIKLPGFAGLGILATPRHRRSNPPLAEFLDALRISPVLEEYMEDLEAARFRRKR